MASYARNSDRNSDVQLSKKLSWLLRHGALKEGFKPDEGGFLYVDDILSHKNFKRFNIIDIERIVSNCSKQRFCLQRSDSDKLKIRANQGHSINVDELELTPITDLSDASQVIHGTYLKNWPSIKEKGLSRMTRNHIHFTAGEPGENEIISGMRKSCNLWIYINVNHAMQDGLQFFRSANNVILCSGNEKGFLLPKYFLKAVQMPSRTLL